MEETGWLAVCAEQGQKNIQRPSLASSLVKVSHHGSRNGYCAGVYASFAQKRRFTAVLTPYKKGRPLPELQGIQELQNHASEIVCTNLNQAYGSVGKRISQRVSSKLSSKWLAALAANGHWAPYLHPSLVSSPSPAPRPRIIPPDLVVFLRHNPELIADLSDESIDDLLPANDTINASRDCRVSFYFDRHGNEISTRRVMGTKAGAYA